MQPTLETFSMTSAQQRLAADGRVELQGQIRDGADGTGDKVRQLLVVKDVGGGVAFTLAAVGGFSVSEAPNGVTFPAVGEEIRGFHLLVDPKVQPINGLVILNLDFDGARRLADSIVTACGQGMAFDQAIATSVSQYPGRFNAYGPDLMRY